MGAVVKGSTAKTTSHIKFKWFHTKNVGAVVKGLQPLHYSARTCTPHCILESILNGMSSKSKCFVPERDYTPGQSGIYSKSKCFVPKRDYTPGQSGMYSKSKCLSPNGIILPARVVCPLNPSVLSPNGITLPARVVGTLNPSVLPPKRRYSCKPLKLSHRTGPELAPIAAVYLTPHPRQTRAAQLQYLVQAHTRHTCGGSCSS